MRICEHRHAAPTAAWLTEGLGAAAGTQSLTRTFEQAGSSTAETSGEHKKNARRSRKLKERRSSCASAVGEKDKVDARFMRAGRATGDSVPRPAAYSQRRQ